jgi:hypothetical protein
MLALLAETALGSDRADREAEPVPPVPPIVVLPVPRRLPEREHPVARD